MYFLYCLFISFGNLFLLLPREAKEIRGNLLPRQIKRERLRGFLERLEDWKESGKSVNLSPVPSKARSIHSTNISCNTPLFVNPQNLLLHIQPLESIEQRQRERQQHLKTYCKRQAGNNTARNLQKEELQYLIVNDKYKVIYCFIPKVACTQWNRVFLALDKRTNVVNEHDPRLFKFLSQYSDEGIKLRLQSYFKFFFVREPFERLLSAYENKFVHKEWPWRAVLHYRNEIVNNYREIDPYSDDEATFTKFIYYVSGVGFNQNRHWATYDKLCHPCDIQYDFIGHFHDMPDEAPYVLRQTGMDRVATFPDFITHNTTDKLLHKYAPIPKAKIAELAKVFEKDFRMFNYNFPGPLSALMADNVN